MSAVQSLWAWWIALSARERLMLGVLAAVLAALAGWYGVISPLSGLANEARAHHQAAAQQLATVEAGVKALRTRNRTDESASITAVVDASATAAGVVIERRREEPGGELTVWIGAVQPKMLMQWILALRQGHAVGVAHMTASRRGAGLEVELTLARTAR